MPLYSPPIRMTSREDHKRYNQSAKGRARTLRYTASDKRKAASRRWNQSAKKRAGDLRYRATEHGTILRKLYDTRPDVRLKKRIYGQERTF